MNIRCKNRITICFTKGEEHLDPKTMDSKAICHFLSHAHTDHLPTTRRKPDFIPKVVCSKVTARLFFERMKYQIEQYNTWKSEDFILATAPSGHTFDSTVAEITDMQTGELIIYTGDINVETRRYLIGYQPKKCDVLILEAT